MYDNICNIILGFCSRRWGWGVERFYLRLKGHGMRATVLAGSGCGAMRWKCHVHMV